MGSATQIAPPAGVDTVALLATALERLVGQVCLHLDPDDADGVEISDEWWAGTHAQIVTVARECADVLDDPRIGAALSAR